MGRKVGPIINVTHPDTPAPRSPRFQVIVIRAEKCCQEHADPITREITCPQQTKCIHWFDKRVALSSISDIPEDRTVKLIAEFEHRRIAWTSQGKLC